MLTIEYNPIYNGESVPDGLLEQFFRTRFERMELHPESEIEITTGNESYMNAVRAVGLIEFPDMWDKVQFKWRDKVITLDKQWGIVDWPYEFCGHNTNWLNIIFGI